MNHKATIRTGYRWRLAVLALLGLGFGGWFIYDGAVGWPHKRAIQLRFQQVRRAHPDNFTQAWAPIARKNHWPDNPGTPLTKWDLFTQYCYAAPSIIFGLLFAGAYLRTTNRWIACDDQGLRTSTGKSAPWNAIQSIDKTRWDKKGIAVVHYQHNHASARITLDDWKYQSQPTAEILAQVEQNLADRADTPSPVTDGAA